MDTIVASGLSAINKGIQNVAEVASKISPDNLENLADDAVTISLSKSQVHAGVAVIKTSEELDKATLSILDEK